VKYFCFVKQGERLVIAKLIPNSVHEIFVIMSHTVRKECLV